ncbi:MAG: hypothetical protein N3G76_03040 [Candidatus Micrarchaeota archaeon]|nr:hypothetical protein [Candidatus Micrarchaeota archaeon]
MQIGKEELSAIIAEYISSYGGEISASVGSISKNRFTVHFSGRVCRACGVEDLFGGLAYALRLEGLHAYMESFKEEKGGYAVTYILRE